VFPMCPSRHDAGTRSHRQLGIQPRYPTPALTCRVPHDCLAGRAFSRSFALWDQLIWIDLRTSVPKLEITVYFLKASTTGERAPEKGIVLR
jgi:hypothetical protein